MSATTSTSEMGSARCPMKGRAARYRLELAGHRQAAERRGGRRDDGDADLNRREEALGLAAQRREGARAGLALIDEVLQARAPYRDHRNLRP